MMQMKSKRNVFILCEYSNPYLVFCSLISAQFFIALRLLFSKQVEFHVSCQILLCAIPNVVWQRHELMHAVMSLSCTSLSFD